MELFAFDPADDFPASGPTRGFDDLRARVVQRKRDVPLDAAKLTEQYVESESTRSSP